MRTAREYAGAPAGGASPRAVVQRSRHSPLRLQPGAKPINPINLIRMYQLHHAESPPPSPPAQDDNGDATRVDAAATLLVCGNLWWLLALGLRHAVRLCFPLRQVPIERSMVCPNHGFVYHRNNEARLPPAKLRLLADSRLDCSISTWFACCLSPTPPTTAHALYPSLPSSFPHRLPSPPSLPSLSPSLPSLCS